MSEVARELGIRPDMLRQWKRQAEAGAGWGATAVFPRNGKLTSQDDEIQRLRRLVRISPAAFRPDEPLRLLLRLRVYR